MRAGSDVGVSLGCDGVSVVFTDHGRVWVGSAYGRDGRLGSVRYFLRWNIHLGSEIDAFRDFGVRGAWSFIHIFSFSIYLFIHFFFPFLHIMYLTVFIKDVHKQIYTDHKKEDWKVPHATRKKTPP